MIILTKKYALKYVLFFAFSINGSSNYSQNKTSISFGEFIITPIEIATIKTKLRNETISESVNIFFNSN